MVAPSEVRVPAIRQSASRRIWIDQGLLLRRSWARTSWTALDAISRASSSESRALALIRSMMPSPSLRAASRTSDWLLLERAARILTCRIRLSSIESVVFTLAILPSCHISLHRGRERATQLLHDQAVERARKLSKRSCDRYRQAEVAHLRIELGRGFEVVEMPDP